LRQASASKSDLARLLAEHGRRTRTARLSADLAAYAAQCLTIRSKTGELVPLAFNRAQQHIHEALERQRRETGKVRALILKGRQQGCSTYVGGRFYHRATHTRGARVFILTHEDAATQNLFEMVERFHAHCPADQRPPTGAANARALDFDTLDSGYKIGTAGTKGVGRSSTIQLFHGSEVAFWPHAEMHAAGVLQAVPDMPDTEVILESTANGFGNFFHQTWADAETGANDFVPIFVPWFWQEEYRRPVPEGFVASEEEREHAALHGLDDAQLAWRRAKIAQLKDAGLFRQEYPASAAEAFQQSGHDSFIAPALIARARKAKCEASGPLVIGFDPAWLGEDRHAMAWRRGRLIEKIEARARLDTMASAGWLKQVIDKDKPRRVFIDVGGVGAGIYDRLREMGFGEIVRAVNFGSAPLEPPPLDEHGNPSGGPAQPPRRDVDEVARVAGRRSRRRDPGPRQPSGRRLRPDLHLRQQLAAQAREQGPHAGARRALARRVGRGGADVCGAGGGAGGVRAEACVSAGGRGVTGHAFTFRFSSHSSPSH
jgi:hypothetical protein